MPLESERVVSGNGPQTSRPCADIRGGPPACDLEQLHVLCHFRTDVFDLVSINSAGAYGQGNYFPATPTSIGSVAAVPEPGTLGLVAAGLAALAVSRRRRA